MVLSFFDESDRKCPSELLLFSYKLKGKLERADVKHDYEQEKFKMVAEKEGTINMEQDHDIEMDLDGVLDQEEPAEQEKKSIYELLEEDIRTSDLSLNEKNERLSRLIRVREKKANIILVGATGSGKSSTINVLFNMEVAKVGVGVNPETASIKSYTLDNLTIWDTPGLGDGVKSDEEYNRMLTKKLSETDENGDPLIDLVLVVLDASSKDLGTSYDLINNVVVPCLGDDKDGRILIGLNQADVAMKGKHWDPEKNEPDEVLTAFLKKKAESVKERIFDGTGLHIRPVYYCAGYKEEGGEQCKPYNLTKLLYYIIKSIPKDKRLAFADNINANDDMWIHDDMEKDYKKKVRRGFFESIGYCMGEGAQSGADTGGVILGLPGIAIGYFIGGALGAVKGLFAGILG